MLGSDRALDSYTYEEFVLESFKVLRATNIGTITHNRHLTGFKSGHEHQCDITVQIEVLGVELLIVIECKSYRRRVEVSDVLEFASRLTDISANKGIIVTTIGYQRGAIRVAKANRIALVVTSPKRPRWRYVARRVSFQSVSLQDDAIPDEKTQPAPTTKRIDKAVPPAEHTTLAIHPGTVGDRPFWWAWRDIVAEQAREAIDQLVSEQWIVLDPECPKCGKHFTQERRLRGRCPKCRATMRPAKFEGGVWCVCKCGKMLHRSGLYVKVRMCRCGHSIPLEDWKSQRSERLSNLFEHLRIEHVKALPELWDTC